MRFAPLFAILLFLVFAFSLSPEFVSCRRPSSRLVPAAPDATRTRLTRSSGTVAPFKASTNDPDGDPTVDSVDERPSGLPSLPAHFVISILSALPYGPSYEPIYAGLGQKAYQKMLSQSTGIQRTAMRIALGRNFGTKIGKCLASSGFALSDAERRRLKRNFIRRAISNKAGKIANEKIREMVPTFAQEYKLDEWGPHMEAMLDEIATAFGADITQKMIACAFKTKKLLVMPGEDKPFDGVLLLQSLPTGDEWPEFYAAIAQRASIDAFKMQNANPMIRNSVSQAELTMFMSNTARCLGINGFITPASPRPLDPSRDETYAQVFKPILDRSEAYTRTLITSNIDTVMSQMRTRLQVMAPQKAVVALLQDVGRTLAFPLLNRSLQCMCVAEAYPAGTTRPSMLPDDAAEIDSADSDSSASHTRDVSVSVEIIA